MKHTEDSKTTLLQHFQSALGTTFARERDTAIEAALDAGHLLMSHFRQPQSVKYKSGKDFTTAMDTEAETLIKNNIRNAFPSHGFLGEEQGISGQESYQWIIDPIDGTFNYTFGLPCFAVSIALVHDGFPIVGVVYDPYCHELFFAQRGGGTWANTSPAATSTRDRLEDALICMDFSYDVDERLTSLDRIKTLIPHIRSFRVMGSAALGLAYVACGRFDGFFHKALKPWDWAAAFLLVEEAGGIVTDLHGGRQKLVNAPQAVLGTNRLMHDTLTEIFRQFDGLET